MSIEFADKGIEIMEKYLKKERKEKDHDNPQKQRVLQRQGQEIMGKILAIKGMVYHFKLNNFKEAELCYQESLKYKKRTNDVYGQGISNGLLGALYYKKGT